MKRQIAGLVFSCSLVSCSDPSNSPQARDIGTSATLYRNSPLNYADRISFASFDAHESGDFNMQNCGMTARVLNANMDAANKAEGGVRNPRLGFWCESGAFTPAGSVPIRFESEFPSNTRSSNRW